MAYASHYLQADAQALPLKKLWRSATLGAAARAQAYYTESGSAREAGKVVGRIAPPRCSYPNNAAALQEEP
jgi:hypothetical protein